jgi:hypothetical protein
MYRVDVCTSSTCVSCSSGVRLYTDCWQSRCTYVACMYKLHMACVYACLTRHINAYKASVRVGPEFTRVSNCIYVLSVVFMHGLHGNAYVCIYTRTPVRVHA